MIPSPAPARAVPHPTARFLPREPVANGPLTRPSGGVLFKRRRRQARSHESPPPMSAWARLSSWQGGTALVWAPHVMSVLDCVGHSVLPPRNWSRRGDDKTVQGKAKWQNSPRDLRHCVCAGFTDLWALRPRRGKVGVVLVICSAPLARTTDGGR
jgi:hypothetical protein